MTRAAFAILAAMALAACGTPREEGEDTASPALCALPNVEAFDNFAKTPPQVAIDLLSRFRDVPTIDSAGRSELALALRGGFFNGSGTGSALLPNRRFVQAFHNGNPLFYDEEYAAASRFGRIVAPQSYFGGGPATGAIASNQGPVPNSHMLFGGDEQWFYGPRVYPGDRLRMDRMLFDYRVTQTAFAGPTLFSRGDTTYVNQRGEFIAKQRATAIRYRADLARQKDSFGSDAAEPTWTEDDLVVPPLPHQEGRPHGPP